MKLQEIMPVVGRRRFIRLAILIVLNIVLALAWQKWLLPQFTQLETDKMTAESERNKLQTEIAQLPTKYEQLKREEARYDALLALGFTEGQDRILARQKMDDLRGQTGLRGISYNIKPQEIITVETMSTPNDDIVKSGIEMDFKALTDVEIRDFIEKMRTEFGGLVITRTIMLERGAELTPDNLAALSRNTPVDFVTGSAVFDWYSLVPKAVNPALTESQAFGGTGQ